MRTAQSFTLSERRILSNVHLRGSDSLTQIAAATGIRLQTVRQTVQRFTNAGLLSGFAMINAYSFGHTEFVVYLSFQTNKCSARPIWCVGTRTR